MINKLLLVLILATAGVVFYYSRWIFFYRYEPEYYENWYYHSQWNIPNSTRGISDGELYKFVGYRLTEGENPFNINFEVPPLGKYIYGAAEKATGNPFLVSGVMYLLVLGIAVIWSREMLGGTRPGLLTGLLLATTPFIATQVAETMLDLPLTLLFLIHIWLMTRYIKNKKWLTLIAAGGFLGLASGVKPPVYTPAAAVLGMAMVIWTERKWLKVLAYPAAVAGGYVAAWFCYFIRHPNPIPWLRLHEKPLKFYLDTNNSVDYLNQWRGIFSNSYQGWWTGASSTLGDWSPILPLGVITAVVIGIWGVKNKRKEWVYVAGMTGVVLLMNTLIPFFPRYLMPAIPLMVLMVVKAAGKKQWLVMGLALINLPFFYSSVVKDDLPGHTQAVARFTQTRAYRELYRSMPAEQRQTIEEKEFISKLERRLDEMGTREVRVKTGEVNRQGEKAEAEYEISYVMRGGETTVKPRLKFIKEREQWRLVWEDNILPVKAEESKGEGAEVWMIPRLMFDWNRGLNYLASITGIDSLEVDRRIKLTVPDEYPRYVGQLKEGVTVEGVARDGVAGVIIRGGNKD